MTDPSAAVDVIHPRRERLPAKRRVETQTIFLVDDTGRSTRLEVSVGFDARHRPREVFAVGPKEGSGLQALVNDTCIAISVALQHGVPALALGASLGDVKSEIDDQGALTVFIGGGIQTTMIGAILHHVDRYGEVAQCPD